MKSLIKRVVTGIFTISVLISCGGNSLESDAKKVAELQCKAQQLLLKANSGDAGILEESMKLTAEAEALSKEIEGKYSSESDQKKFAEAMLKEMSNCQ